MSMIVNPIIQRIKDFPKSCVEKITDKFSIEKITVGVKSWNAFDKVGYLGKEAARYRTMAKNSPTKEREGYFFEAGTRMLEAARISSKYGLNPLVPKSGTTYNRGAHLENALALYSAAITDFDETNELPLIIETEIEARDFLNTMLADKEYHEYTKCSRLYNMLVKDRNIN